MKKTILAIAALASLAGAAQAQTFKNNAQDAINSLNTPGWTYEQRNFTTYTPLRAQSFYTTKRGNL